MGAGAGGMMAYRRRVHCAIAVACSLMRASWSHSVSLCISFWPLAWWKPFSYDCNCIMGPISATGVSVLDQQQVPQNAFYSWWAWWWKLSASSGLWLTRSLWEMGEKRAEKQDYRLVLWLPEVKTIFDVHCRCWRESPLWQVPTNGIIMEGIRHWIETGDHREGK